MSVRDTAPNKQAQDRSNFITRVLTALVAGPIVLLIVYIGGWPYVLLAALLGTLAVIEFDLLGRDRDMQGNAVVSVLALLGILASFMAGQYTLILVILLLAGGAVFVIESLRGAPRPAYRLLTTVAGLIYIAFPTAFLIGIRQRSDGLLWLLLVIAFTWGTDTFAYLGGRLWGKHPLAPRISPKKTVEGAVVGLIGGFVPGLLILALGNMLTPATFALALIAPPVAIIGDLFESRIKRFFHAGDSHVSGLNILPGHGGVLDRTDSLIWVVTLCYGFILLTGLTG
jgi:phosphatidate cytidylyltransferase